MEKSPVLIGKKSGREREDLISLSLISFFLDIKDLHSNLIRRWSKTLRDGLYEKYLQFPDLPRLGTEFALTSISLSR